MASIRQAVVSIWKNNNDENRSRTWLQFKRKTCSPSPRTITWTFTITTSSLGPAFPGWLRISMVELWAMFWENCIVFCLEVITRNEDDETMGQITSVAVCREYRRLGLANKLMRQAQIKMIELYNCKTCALHVRESNYAARHMYEDVLGFK